MQSNAAAVFTYDWDAGSPWRVVDKDGVKQVIECKVDETEAFRAIQKETQWKFKTGERVLSLQGSVPIVGTVVELKAPGFVVVEDDSTGLKSEIAEASLESLKDPVLTSFFVPSI